MDSQRSPGNARVKELLVHASAALAQRDLAGAERHVRGALALAPADPDALHLHAAVLRQHGRTAEAIAALRRAVAKRPDDPALLNALGVAQQAAGESDAAIDTFRHACRIAPRTAALQANLGKALLDAGDPEAAAVALQTALGLDPALIEPRFALAYAHRIRGRLREAEAELRAVLLRHPHDGGAWLGLAEIDAPLGEDDLAQMRDGLADARVRGSSRVALGFALAHALEADARYGQAWDALLAANAEARRAEPWDAGVARADVDATLRAFAAMPEPTPDTRGSETIFIVGLPRSGSTLVEQILASHPDVEGAGELTDLPAVLDAESHRRGCRPAQWAREAGEADWRRLGEDYLSRTSHLRRARPRSTDKLPGNWRHLGVLRRMLPGARVIACRRDPVETALACFARLFAPGMQRFSYDLGDIASHWRDFDRTIRFFAPRAAHALREQSYETLVADPEAEIAALLAFCGLGFDPACLEPHRTDRLVRTHSAAQVRRPLRSARMRATVYDSLLDPLRRMLSDP